MPEIRIRQEVDYDVNVEIYCGTCGRGLCSETTVDSRRMSLSVNVCPYCIAEKEEKIKDLEEIIRQLDNDNA